MDSGWGSRSRGLSERERVVGADSLNVEIRPVSGSRTGKWKTERWRASTTRSRFFAIFRPLGVRFRRGRAAQDSGLVRSYTIVAHVATSFSLLFSRF